MKSCCKQGDDNNGTNNKLVKLLWSLILLGIILFATIQQLIND